MTRFVVDFTGYPVSERRVTFRVGKDDTAVIVGAYDDRLDDDLPLFRYSDLDRDRDGR